MTSRLAEEYWGSMPPLTVRGIAAIQDGRVIGLAGVCLMGTFWMVFSDTDDVFWKDKRAVVRAVRAIRKLIENLTLPVYAMVQEDKEKAEEFIEHVGGIEKWLS